MFCYCFRIPFRILCYISSSSFLSSSWLKQFLRLSLFLIILRVLRNTGQVFCRMFFSRYWSDVFLVIGFEVKDNKIKVTFASHHIKCTYCLYEITCGVNLQYLPEVVFVSFLYYEVFIFSSLPILYFGRKLLYTTHI